LNLTCHDRFGPKGKGLTHQNLMPELILWWFSLYRPYRWSSTREASVRVRSA